MKSITAIIRNRYQLTIPEEIRKYLLWLAPKRAVKIKLIEGEKILVEPYSEKQIDWVSIWSKINTIKSQGKKTSLAKFVIQDREKH